MSLAKKYLKSRPVSKVTFVLPSDRANGASRVAIVGEFNGWDRNATEMRRLKSGEFKATLDLEVGREYQFRYLLDDAHWTNDDQADRYGPSGVPAEDNSVVVV